MPEPVLHVISHTDLDGVAAAAVAWHFHYPRRAPIRISLIGYGEIDSVLLETVRLGQEPLVLDLFCQKQETVDELDRIYDKESIPFLFDHHMTTQERYGNRPWAVIDTRYCGAMVYMRWLIERGLSEEEKTRLDPLYDLVEIANDRDLWLGKREESRLWQALITLCGPWSVLARLVDNPFSSLLPSEREAAEDFVTRQEERFERARSEITRVGKDFVFLGPDILEYGDVSDFCGLLLDRSENPPLLVAIANRRPGGDWAVSMRSRNGLSGLMVGLLKDGRKVRGGGHGDAAALYFPAHYTLDQIRETIVAAMKVEEEKKEPLGVTLGDLLKRGNA